MATLSKPMDAIARANDRAYEKLSFFRSVINSQERKKESIASNTKPVKVQKEKK